MVFILLRVSCLMDNNKFFQQLFNTSLNQSINVMRPRTATGNVDDWQIILILNSEFRNLSERRIGGNSEFSYWITCNNRFASWKKLTRAIPRNTNFAGKMRDNFISKAGLKRLLVNNHWYS